MTAALREEWAEWGVQVTQAGETEDIDLVAECNWESLQSFLACDSQWRASGVGLAGLVWIGLDYTACDVSFRRYGFADDCWDDLRFMEDVVLPILNGGDD